MSGTKIIAEGGINHNGDMSVARGLIDAAVVAGCDTSSGKKEIQTYVYQNTRKIL